jgi:hypothetical protein
MPARSVKLTLSNNTSFALTLVGASGPCHGSWTDPLQPPSVIQPRSHGTWESESSGILTGTEGWVKYVIENDDHDSNSGQPCMHELVYIHWDNPFVWDNSTNPLDFSVTTTDRTPPCDADKGVLDHPGEFTTVFTGTGRSQNCRHELFVAGVDRQGLTVDFAAALFGWPAILLNNILGTGQANINFSITLGLRQQGSVDQTILSFHDGRLGLRPLAKEVGETSVRALLRM